MQSDIQGTDEDYEEAWKMYTWMNALIWNHLPEPGGLRDQPEMLMSNIFRIHAQVENNRRVANGR